MQPKHSVRRDRQAYTATYVAVDFDQNGIQMQNRVDAIVPVCMSFNPPHNHRIHDERRSRGCWSGESFVAAA
ncbi:MAG: hypothetical protein AAF802_33405 [Planctomycetota bacterium]